MNWLIVALCILSLVAVFTIQTYTGMQLPGLSTISPPDSNVSSTLNITRISKETFTTFTGWNTIASNVSRAAFENIGVRKAYANLWAFLGMTGIQMIIVAVSDVFTNWMFANSSFNIHRLMLSKQ